ncbi:DUF4369 domain-containing protein [Mucilaginibacter sp. SJ]|uniref:DUF4369 domain-containing protein n=1 Tax=Mucilaginibacter sp. SJ TaxID=3029053 RepID=UPI0023AA132F|nr:DUF4369 domain-containing protein [Mucilaginibacter sp. SJ]WEA00588.1 DUF4369 domain-containing protein [Mucilaginibacter sp. SJ]
MKKTIAAIISLCLPILISAQTVRPSNNSDTNAGAGKAIKYKPFIVDGYIKGMDDGYVKLIYSKTRDNDKRSFVRDSVLVKNGRFSINGNIDIPTYALLENMRYLYQVNFWLDTTRQRFEGAIDNDDFKLTGSPTQDEDVLFHASYDAYSDKQGEANYELWSGKTRRESEAVIKRYQKASDSITNIKNEFAAQFVKTHPNSRVSMNYMFNCTAPGNEAYAERVFSYLTEELRESESGKTIVRKLNAIKGTTVGNVFPEFVLADIGGNLVKRSDFKGKYLLLRVGSSAEKFYSNSASELNSLKLLNDSYATKGFAIADIIVTIKDSASLSALLQTQKIPWIVLSGSSGQHPPITETLNITRFPSWFLVNPDGKLVARDLTIDDLSDKLKEICK